METDLVKLKELCELLGGEEWTYQRTSIHSNGYVVNQKGQTVVNVSTGDVPAKYCRFIEQSDPRTVLELIEQLEKSREECDNLLRRAVRAENALGQGMSDSDYNGAVADGILMISNILSESHSDMTRSLFSRIGRSVNIQILENLIPALKRIETRIRTAKERVK